MVGVDMTEAQLAVAARHRAYHRQAFGFARDNVDLRLGHIERLDVAGPAGGLLRLRGLQLRGQPPTRQGRGAARGPPAAQARRRVVLFRCLRRPPRAGRGAGGPGPLRRVSGGRLVLERLPGPGAAPGIRRSRLVEDRPIAVTDPALAARTQDIGFYSATYRLFKLKGLEDDCEDYGQAVVYRGGIPGHERRLDFDKYHRIEAGRVFPVCGNTWRMLHETRFRPYFDFIGDFSRHYGIFPGCSGGLPFDGDGLANGSGSC